MEAGVPYFIDQQLAGAYGAGAQFYKQGPFGSVTPFQGYQLPLRPAQLYRVGIAATDQYCQQTYGQLFAALDVAKQEEVLRGLQAIADDLNLKEIPGTAFFARLLTDTMDGFFAEPAYGGNQNLIGWKLVGFPGVAANYAEAIGRHNSGSSIASDADRLLVFQRTPHWLMNNPNYHKEVSAGNKWAIQHIPFFANWLRFQLFWAGSDGFHASLQMDPDWPMPDSSLNAANYKMRQLLIDYVRKELEDDKELLAKVIPSYPPYGKRMLRDNHWYRMLKRANVKLATGSISHVNPDAIVMPDGTDHPADVIIMATGFHASKMLWPMDIRGRGGRTIRGVWGDDDPRAYLRITVPSFPNLFLTYVPNTNLAHGGSIIFHTECQVRYITQALREMIENGSSTLEYAPTCMTAITSWWTRSAATSSGPTRG